MAIELARARLRGIYAIVAGAILILIVPFFEASVLSSTGYLSAVDQISQRHDFGSYLNWVGQNQELDVLFHIVQFIAFLLAFLLPVTLRTLLWPAITSTRSLVTRFSGQLGFACYALAVLLGLLVSGNSGTAYVNATTAVERASIAAHFGSLYGIQNILAHIVGGLLVALAVMLFSARMMRQGQKTIPTWLGYLGVLVAALLVITALQFAAEPAAPETSISSLSFFGLALFLVSAGICLLRLRTLPANAANQPRASKAANGPVAPERTDSSASILDNNDVTNDQSHQSDGQSVPGETRQ